MEKRISKIGLGKRNSWRKTVGFENRDNWIVSSPVRMYEVTNWLTYRRGISLRYVLNNRMYIINWAGDKMLTENGVKQIVGREITRIETEGRDGEK